MYDTKEGYLLDINNWEREFAIHTANLLDIELEEIHWLLITFIQNFYIKYSTTPSMRILITMLREKGFKDINSISMQHLLQHAPIKNLCKLAGLPEPIKCT